MRVFSTEIRCYSTSRINFDSSGAITGARYEAGKYTGQCAVEMQVLPYVRKYKVRPGWANVKSRYMFRGLGGGRFEFGIK